MNTFSSCLSELYSLCESCCAASMGRYTCTVITESLTITQMSCLMKYFGKTWRGSLNSIVWMFANQKLY